MTLTYPRFFAKPYTLGGLDKKPSLYSKLRGDLAVVIIATLIFGFGIAFGGALLEAAAIAGGTIVISCAFVLAGMSIACRTKFLTWCAKQGWWLDLLITVALTVGGFSHGAVMGTMGIFLGLGLSAGFSITRIIHRLRNPNTPLHKGD